VSDPSLQFRPYDPRDAAAVGRLHEVAIRETGVDPADIPGTEDLQSIEETYVESGGGFLVGTLPAESAQDGESDAGALATHDGRLVAMGGYLPNEAGHGDERDRPGAAELHRMRVAPAHQRRGYGQALLERLEAAAADAGFSLLLATTSTRQQAALSFYAANGYERVGASVEGEYELVHFEKGL